jgi:hypothetical protein
MDSFVTASTRTQELATSAMRTWTDGMQAFTQGQNVFAEAPAMMNRYLEAVQQVMDSQRQFFEVMLNAAQSAQTFTKQASRAAEQTAGAMSTAADSGADVAKAAKSQTSAMARTARIVTG